MSYHCGIGASLAHEFGGAPCDPHIVCDGCGITRSIYRSKTVYEPAAWFFDGKHAPGWSGGRVAGTHRREDWCPTCRPRKKGGGR